MLRGGGGPFPTLGSGTNSVGYWLGTAGDGTSKLIAAPKSTEVQRAWGSQGIQRGTTNTNDGVANTTTLFNLGSYAHPAAYHCRALTTGGYNTWYQPAKNELNTLNSNKSATPFATANGFVGDRYWSSSEGVGSYSGSAWAQNMSTGSQNYGGYKYTSLYIRAVRRSTI